MAAEKQLAAQSTIISTMEAELAEKKNEVVVLKASLRDSENRVDELQQEIHLYKPGTSKFLADDKKARYYTGLPTIAHFKKLLAYINPEVTHNNCVLSNETQFLLVLMKLRLNLQHKDLAYRFGVSKSTVSRYVVKWIDLMHVKLKPLIELAWPSDEVLQKTMPMCFRSLYPNCKVIIDCFEIFCDRPKNLTKQASVYSNYKHHPTVKTLIGITPHGCTSFISKTFLGRQTDKNIVIESGFLAKLKRGDGVMADRGFLIGEILQAIGAVLIIPAFKGRNSQLSHQEVEESREVANLRIHVERVIGLGKNRYGILRGPLKPYTLLVDDGGISFIEKIITVSFALLNLTPPIVPLDM